MVELNEVYFSFEVADQTKLKRGKGSHKKNKVLVMAESTPLENPVTAANSTACRYFKMKVVTGHDSSPVVKMLKEN